MKTKLVVISLVLSVCTVTSAQQVSIGVFGGGSHYLGELNDNSFYVGDLHPAAGGFIRYLPNPYLGFRLGVTAGTISGTDDEFPGASEWQFRRHLSFTSHILEVAVLAEFNVFGYDVDDQRFSPYLFAGVAGFNFNPRARKNGEWQYLQPLNTEGQGTSAFPDREPYSLYQVAVPFGMGFHFGLGAGLTLSFEGGLRYTFTDYLDDVSTTYVDQNILILERGVTSWDFSNRTHLYGFIDYGNDDPRGNPEDDDWYGFAGLTFSYTLGAGNGGSKKRGCDYGF